MAFSIDLQIVSFLPWWLQFKRFKPSGGIHKSLFSSQSQSPELKNVQVVVMVVRSTRDLEKGGLREPHVIKLPQQPRADQVKSDFGSANSPSACGSSDKQEEIICRGGQKQSVPQNLGMSSI